MKGRLFVWEPDRARRYARFEEPPTSAAGEEVLLFDGAELPADIGALQLAKPRAGELGDFLYDVGLLLFASQRAASVIAAANTPSVGLHPVSVVDRMKREIAKYFWLNVKNAVRLLDRERSVFRETPSGHIVEIGLFCVDKDRVPEEDLFIVAEGALRIFSEDLVRRLEEAGITGASFAELEGVRWPR